MKQRREAAAYCIASNPGPGWLLDNGILLSIRGLQKYTVLLPGDVGFGRGQTQQLLYFLHCFQSHTRLARVVFSTIETDQPKGVSKPKQCGDVVSGFLFLHPNIEIGLIANS